MSTINLTYDDAKRADTVSWVLGEHGHRNLQSWVDDLRSRATREPETAPGSLAEDSTASGAPVDVEPVEERSRWIDGRPGYSECRTMGEEVCGPVGGYVERRGW